MIKLVESKVQAPSLSANLIKRDRLVNRLRNNLGMSASFVCAGPGWGKTTLAAEFLNSISIPGVWYEVDAADGDIAVFFSYLVAAIRHAIPTFGQSTLDLLRSGSGSTSDQLVDLFLYELAESADPQFAIVLDNLHHLFATDWCASVIHRLLQLLPNNVHFVLLARVAPGFTFSRLRSKQTLDQIEDRALAFTRSEATELFQNTFDDPESIDRLLGWTQGWVAGLQIIRKALSYDQSLKQQEIEEIITHSQTEIFEYFARCVWNAEPQRRREFLIRSSLPDHLTTDVLNEALGLSVSTEELQIILRENVFLSRHAGESDVYTYHPLFRDFLRKQLKFEVTEEQLSEIHIRLGEYYARRENWGLALEHFFEAGEESTAATTLVSAERALLAGGLTQTVSSCLPRFGLETLESYPQLHNIIGQVRIIEGNPSGADDSFRAALNGARLLNDQAAEAAALAGLAHSAVRRHDFTSALAYSEAAADCIATGKVSNQSDIEAQIKNVEGAIRVFEGRYAEANALMEQALRLAHEVGDIRLVKSISHNLALPSFMEGDFHAALRCFSRGPISGDSGTRRSLHPDSVLLYLNRATVHTALGHLALAESDLTNADELARLFNLRGFVSRIIEAWGNIAREERQFEKAEKIYCAALEEYRTVGVDPIKTDLYYERALLELYRGDLDRALDFIEPMISDREQNQREIELALARQMCARVLVESSDPTALLEIDASEPLFRRLQCNYYLAISCYLRARVLSARDFERGREAFSEFLRLAERFDYSYFARSEQSFHPILFDLCKIYSISSAWLSLALDTGEHMAQSS